MYRCKFQSVAALPDVAAVRRQAGRQACRPTCAQHCRCSPRWISGMDWPGTQSLCKKLPSVCLLNWRMTFDGLSFCLVLFAILFLSLFTPVLCAADREIWHRGNQLGRFPGRNHSISLICLLICSLTGCWFQRHYGRESNKGTIVSLLTALQTNCAQIYEVLTAIQTQDVQTQGVLPGVIQSLRGWQTGLGPPAQRAISRFVAEKWNIIHTDHLYPVNAYNRSSCTFGDVTTIAIWYENNQEYCNWSWLHKILQVQMLYKSMSYLQLKLWYFTTKNICNGLCVVKVLWTLPTACICI